MTNDPLVSVLMTSYNRERYIGAAIDSVRASSYGNWELIITDDGSKDATVDIARGYSAKDSRIKVYVNEKNLGDYPNRIRAASYAQGKYLKYIDADDYIYPWGLQLLVQMMEQFPEAGYGFCSLLPDDARWYPFKLSPAEAYRYHYSGKNIFFKAPLSAIIRRDAFESVGGFSGRRYYGDFELWHLLSLRYDVILMPEGMVWHRLHEEQESRFNRVNPLVDFSYDVAAVNFFNNEQRIPMTAEEKAEVLAKYRRKMQRTMIRQLIKSRFKVVRDMRKMMRGNEHNFKKI